MSTTNPQIGRTFHNLVFTVISSAMYLVMNLEANRYLSIVISDLDWTGLGYLNGMWLLFVVRAWITSPRADKDLLMLCASLRRSPWASLLATLSLPARSTSQSLLFVHSPVIVFSPLTITHNMLFHDSKPQ